jgi:membrane protein implicated in regulation of membrane protease activity
MPWWGWIAVGAILLGSELMLVDAEFYLVFIGVSAVAVGLAGLAGYGGPEWVQWLIFGLLSLFFMVGFRSRLYRKLRGDLPGYTDSVVGQILRMDEALAPEAETRVEFRGTTWRVRNTGPESIAPGGKARIEHAEGLMLHVRRAD